MTASASVGFEQQVLASPWRPPARLHAFPCLLCCCLPLHHYRIDATWSLACPPLACQPACLRDDQVIQFPYQYAVRASLALARRTPKLDAEDNIQGDRLMLCNSPRPGTQFCSTNTGLAIAAPLLLFPIPIPFSFIWRLPWLPREARHLAVGANHGRMTAGSIAPCCMVEVRSLPGVT